MKQGFGKLAGLKEAREVLANLVNETKEISIKLREALGYVLAEDIISEIDVPNFQKSAMDGYAVRAEDTFGATESKPKKLKIIDSITAGIVSNKELQEKQCIRITTGAPLPNGADSVVMVEYTQEENDTVLIYKAIAPENNVVKLGSDVLEKDLILKKGTKLNSRYIGVLSAIGKIEIKVKEKPTIAYFSTGNEVVMPGTELKPGKIYDINSATICSEIKEQGCNLIDLGLVEDNLEKIKETIRNGIKNSDFLLLSGGSSLGGEDYMVQAVAELGKVHIHGIAVKPGKPVLVGEVEGKLVLGLPGYPTSALSNFFILVVPIIRHMQGELTKNKTINRKLSRKIVSTIGRYQFLAVKIDEEYAYPILKGSSSITTLTESDGFVGIEENTEVVNKDDKVEVMMF
jgi:molybdopterin molybdotransferase